MLKRGKVRTRRPERMTHYDKIKKMLSGKSNEELRNIAESLLDEAKKRGKHINSNFLIQYIYWKTGKIPNISESELIKLITDISWKLGEDRRKFDFQKYMKNVFKGRQKGRAYKTFT
jgi:hypothetical protein